VTPLERRAAIVRLLEALTDGLPVPARTPMSTLGFVHGTSARESCTDCLANGFVSRDCETCEGRGYVETRRLRDPYDTGAAPGWFGSSAAKHERDHERDAELARLEVQLAAPRTAAELVAEARPERWEKERDRLHERYHLAELGRALEQLAVADVDAYRAVHAVHVYGWLPCIGLAAECVERALAFVAALLPDPLRAPPAATPTATAAPMTVAARDREIRRLVLDGAASQWIAARFSLSVSQVNRIAAGEREPA
jgi:hypothetical protein